jgi:hypothetical protein
VIERSVELRCVDGGVVIERSAELRCVDGGVVIERSVELRCVDGGATGACIYVAIERSVDAGKPVAEYMR